METSPILSRQEFNQIVGLAGDYILNWFQKEIDFLTRKKLVLRELDNNIYTINNFGLVKTNHRTWQVYREQRLLHEFNYKENACFYCLFWLDTEVSLAKEILSLDYTLGSLMHDNEVYKIKLNDAKTTLKKDIFLARYNQNLQRINIIRHRLRKIIDQAKYKKTRKLYEP
jgi:hypothetical protein